MSYDRCWLEETGSEDSHGRALWGLGVAATLGRNDGQLSHAADLFQRALPAVENFTSPRAVAFAVILSCLKLDYLWLFYILGIHRLSSILAA